VTAAPDVSVIIVNYQGERLLEACLDAVLRDAGPETEVIVVDNASTDGSVALIATRFPGVQVLALDRNAGFAAGNNAGARRARGRFLAFLNNDTEPQAGWLRALRAAREAHPSAALATARIVFRDDPAILDSAGDGYTAWGGAYKRGHGRAASSEAEPREVFGACGAAFMIRREVFEEVGGFDEEFFLSHEDVDLSYRIQLTGRGCRYVPGAVVWHAGSASLGRVSRRAVYYGQRNLEWVYLKNTPWPLLIRTLPGHVIYAVASGVYHAAIGHLGAYAAGKWAAIRGAPGMWRKRRAIQGRARTSVRRLSALMDRGWLRLKWREKRFDLRLAKPSSR
jgi:GT2 family glycosyltransferase